MILCCHLARQRLKISSSRQFVKWTVPWASDDSTTCPSTNPLDVARRFRSSARVRMDSFTKIEGKMKFEMIFENPTGSNDKFFSNWRTFIAHTGMKCLLIYTFSDFRAYNINKTNTEWCIRWRVWFNLSLWTNFTVCSSWIIFHCLVYLKCADVSPVECWYLNALNISTEFFYDDLVFKQRPLCPSLHTGDFIPLSLQIREINCR